MYIYMYVNIGWLDYILVDRRVKQENRGVLLHIILSFSRYGQSYSSLTCFTKACQSTTYMSTQTTTGVTQQTTKMTTMLCYFFSHQQQSQEV